MCIQVYKKKIKKIVHEVGMAVQISNETRIVGMIEYMMGIYTLLLSEPTLSEPTLSSYVIHVSSLLYILVSVPYVYSFFLFVTSCTYPKGSSAFVSCYCPLFILPARFVMEKVDLIMVGAEVVAESGGIINKVGVVKSIQVVDCVYC